MPVGVADKAVELAECNGGLIADNYITNTFDGPQVICGTAIGAFIPARRRMKDPRRGRLSSGGMCVRQFLGVRAPVPGRAARRPTLRPETHP